MIEYCETHCHLNHPRYDADRDAVLARARAAGVTRLVVIGYDLESSRRAAEMADPAGGLFAAAGVHPHDAASWDAAAEREVRRLLGLPGVVALGEIGLDFYRDLSPRADQYAAFRAQVDLALERDVPIVVHTRDSVGETLETLAPYAARGVRGVLHCWSGSAAEARRAVALGFLLGIGGVITYARPGALPEVVAEAPAASLLLETDCPYLAPVPHRGGRNEPAYLPLIAARVAASRGAAVEEVAAVTAQNAARLFRLAA